MTQDDSSRTEPAVHDDVVQSRYRGALMGVAVGDAIGAAFEGSPGPIPLNRLRLHLDAATPAPYTDDTAMTIAVSESVLHSDGLDEDHLAETFSTRYEREPRRGYGAGTAGLLRRIAQGGAWRTLAPAQFGGTGSYGNGAAMRSAPFGLWAADHRSAAELARRAAHTTHSHPHAVDAAGVQAAAVASAIALTDDDHDPVDRVHDRSHQRSPARRSGHSHTLARTVRRHRLDAGLGRPVLHPPARPLNERGPRGWGLRQ